MSVSLPRCASPMLRWPAPCKSHRSNGFAHRSRGPNSCRACDSVSAPASVCDFPASVSAPLTSRRSKEFSYRGRGPSSCRAWDCVCAPASVCYFLASMARSLGKWLKQCIYIPKQELNWKFHNDDIILPLYSGISCVSISPRHNTQWYPSLFFWDAAVSGIPNIFRPG